MAKKRMNKPKVVKRRARKSKSSPQLGDPQRYLRALLDPFHINASGVKVPDFDGTPSFTVTSRDLYTLSSDGNGAIGKICLFSTPYKRDISAFNSTTSSVDFNSGSTYNSWSDYSGLLSTANSATTRLVAGGLRITNLMSIAGTNAAAGRLIIAPVSGNLAYSIYTNVSTTTVTESLLRKQPGAMLIPLSALAASDYPVIATTAPMDPSALCYVVPNLTSTVANDMPNHVAFIIAVFGAPASSVVLEVEEVAHWEACPTLVNGTLCTPGISTSYSVFETAINAAQRADPVKWASSAVKAFNYVSQMASAFSSRTGGVLRLEN